MKNLSVFSVIVLILLGCNKSLQPAKPDDLIPKDKMVSILKEMFVVNAAKGMNRRLLEKNGVEPEMYILNRFNIDSTQFAHSNDYYAHDIETYQFIIDQVKDQITKDKDSLEKITEKEKETAAKRRDSLKSIQPLIPKKKGLETKKLELEELKN